VRHLVACRGSSGRPRGDYRPERAAAAAAHWEQAKAFASSVWAGDAEALGYITQTVKDVAETYLPHKK
jgi:hypothetical protein